MANKYLEENYAQDIALADLASKTGFSTNYFSSILFCSATGQVGRQYGWYCQICDRKTQKGLRKKELKTPAFTAPLIDDEIVTDNSLFFSVL
ncbi:MAG: helix-turn-helix transcriptional regulator [Lachnospiraceae bacterium]|nr:helix-turn-helix transcriptional regulator [Lachnospiraceae bacterium]